MTPAVAASAVIASELPIVTRMGTPTTTSSSGTRRKAPPAPTRPAAKPTPPATVAVSVRLYSRSSAGAATSGCGAGTNISTHASVTMSAKTMSSHISWIQSDAIAPAREVAAIARPPVAARRALTARRRPCAMTPETAAMKTCTIVIAATSLTSKPPMPSSGGT